MAEVWVIVNTGWVRFESVSSIFTLESFHDGEGRLWGEVSGVRGDLRLPPKPFSFSACSPFDRFLLLGVFLRVKVLKVAGPVGFSLTCLWPE